MNIHAFSCIRPNPDQIGEALSLGIACDSDVSSALVSKVLTLDISQALYLYAYSDGTHTWHALIACMEPDQAPAPSTKRYQIEPVQVSYPSNLALDIILNAATGAVPLYNVQNGSQQIVVWRISRKEALEALEATFATLTATTTPELPYARTLVALCSEDNLNMPAIPTGLFAHAI